MKFIELNFTNLIRSVNVITETLEKVHTSHVTAAIDLLDSPIHIVCTYSHI